MPVEFCGDKMNRYDKNQSGYSLVGLVMATAITAIVALGAAYILSNSQNVSSFGTLQNEIDRIHYLNLQLSRNPAFIMRQPGFEKTGALYHCLQHSPLPGSDCTQLRAPANYVTPPPQTGTPLQKNISSSISFQPTCPDSQGCTAVALTTMTTYNSSSKSSSVSFQPRRSVSVIPGYILVPAVGFNYNCVLNQGLITLLNYETSRVNCQPLKGTLSNSVAPLANFGPLTPPTTQDMTDKNCGANGFSSVGSFQNQTACMVPVPTAVPPPTTVKPAPPTTVRPLPPPPPRVTTTTTVKKTTTTTTTVPAFGRWIVSSKISKAPSFSKLCVYGAPASGTSGASEPLASKCTKATRGATANCGYDSFLWFFTCQYP
jgi:hypothetical protein